MGLHSANVCTFLKQKKILFINELASSVYSTAGCPATFNCRNFFWSKTFMIATHVECTGNKLEIVLLALDQLLRSTSLDSFVMRIIKTVLLAVGHLG